MNASLMFQQKNETFPVTHCGIFCPEANFIINMLECCGNKIENKIENGKLLIQFELKNAQGQKQQLQHIRCSKSDHRRKQL